MGQWKNIEGFERYEVSTEGKVKNRKTGRLLKPGTDTYGYLRVILSVNGKAVGKSVHRLVAESFIPNPERKTQVNHIDEDKTNNNINNLEWMTSKENNNYGTRKDRVAAALSKPIIVIHQDGTYEEYPSAWATARELGLSQSGIVGVLKGRRKTYHGLNFKYAENQK